MRINSLPAPEVLGNRKILLRLDLNVPLAGTRIADDYKIREAVPAISRFKGNPLIIISHLGEPKPAGDYQAIKGLSLGPVAQRLANLLGRPVSLVSGSWEEIARRAASLQPGAIMLLENIRFWKGETANDPAFARRLAALADLYVNDAFAVSHRRHASVDAIKKLLPSYAGSLLEKEVRKLVRALKGPRPRIVIMGGAKISTKLPLIEKFLVRSDRILIGGGLANDLLRSKGEEIGRSYHDSHETPQASVAALLRSRKLVLPSDAIVVTAAKNGSFKGPGRRAQIGALKATDAIVDIGPEAVKEFVRLISSAKTVIWNGPMGVFEKPYAQKGTKAIALALAAAAKRGAAVIAGGGETVAAIGLFKKSSSLDWVAAGGGASLSFLAGEPMPGLEGLIS